MAFVVMGGRSAVLDFASTMRLGQAQYQDVLDALRAAGLQAGFTQTGGMNAALEVMLDGGYGLLVTDAEDSLAWARAEHEGWTVGLYAPDQRYDGECLHWATTEDPGTEALLELVRRLLQTAARQR